ncbi:MAG: DNA-3-methyladenine glycosylase [Terrimicrobiaceae bacterium]|nr:DNA-3-methyladenine glycosylase [Terrimicrobiaceae bacterium]
MIEREFFTRSPLACARGLIGARLVWGGCEGLIVETEAYDAAGDPACHTFFRPSARAFVERHAAGAAYVYLNYGVHWLFNVLVKGGRRTGFVLIRAVEPIEGIVAMAERRRLDDVRKLCSGPGRLTQAFAIDGGHHGLDLCANPDFAFRERAARPRVAADGRIGISTAAELPWRFTLAGSRYISAPVAARRAV